MFGVHSYIVWSQELLEGGREKEKTKFIDKYTNFNSEYC